MKRPAWRRVQRGRCLGQCRLQQLAASELFQLTLRFISLAATAGREERSAGEHPRRRTQAAKAPLEAPLLQASCAARTRRRRRPVDAASSLRGEGAQHFLGMYHAPRARWREQQRQRRRLGQPALTLWAAVLGWVGLLSSSACHARKTTKGSYSREPLQVPLRSAPPPIGSDACGYTPRITWDTT